MSTKQNTPIGGGVKKIVYAMQTIKRIGLLSSKKALSSNNACKACGLGMGGQKGGMVNEAGEFPSVCNKSIQAQSTDIQAPIPDEIFDFSIDDFKCLSAYEIEHLGRLGKPIFKGKNEHTFKTVKWDWALHYAANKFINNNPERSFFYSSGRSSNEAGFVLQLLARMYGTNNVNNCSYYCHQATSEGMVSTIGAGTATVELDDLDRCDLVFLIGANPASNHPRLVHKLKACRDRGGDVVVINPAKEPGLVKFALPKNLRSIMSGGSEIASHYLQPKIGSDLLLFKGISKWLIDNNKLDSEFIARHVDGYSNFKTDIEKTDWSTIEKTTGLTQTQITEIATVYASSRNTVFAWGMGITHHRHGVDNVEYIANLALLRGMIGKPGRGLLPLRGHSNVQGIGTIGVKPVLADDVLNQMQRTLGINLSVSTPGLDTLASLEAAHSGNIDAALIMGGNLYQATPHSIWAANALDNITFKLFLTTTLNKGHVETSDNSEALILPVVARDEEPEPTTQESMFNYVRLSDGGIRRLEHARSEVDILADLGSLILDKSLDKSLAGNSQFDFQAFKSRSTIREAISEIVPGMQDLKTIDVAKQEFHIRNRLMHEPNFKTKNGRANMQVRNLQTEINNEYPYLLTTVRSEGQFNSIIYEQVDSYRGINSRWSIMMNADDIIEHNLSSGDHINLQSANGEMKAVEIRAFDIPRGNIMAYYPEANILTGLERDARSKTPAFKSTPVKIVQI